MPLPLLGLAAGLAGIAGISGHLSAKERNEEAQRVADDAQALYNKTKHSLESAREKAEQKLLQLGYSKKYVLDTSMSQFLEAYEKLKKAQLTESVGLNEISKFTIDQQGMIEIRQLTDIYSSSIKSGAAGAATGALVALAASGSLGVVTSGLSAAGTMLTMGEVGAAASVAGSALSFGVACTPLAAVAAPVVLFTGISASMQADENLEKANTMYAEAEAASEKMKVSITLCDAVSERSQMFDDLLNDLNEMFAECSALMAGVIKKKEGIFKKKLTRADFNENDQKLFAVTRTLAGTVKAIIDTPLLSAGGNIAYESQEKYNSIVNVLPQQRQQVDEIKRLDFKVRAKVAKPAKGRVGTSGKNQIVATAVSGLRKVVALALGFILASTFASSVAESISTTATNVLFIDSYTANSIAMWLLICISVMMLIGKFNNTYIEKWCGLLSAISMAILYVQYVRTVELMDHYIIFSILFFAGCFVLFRILTSKERKWDGVAYFEYLLSALCRIPVFFALYALFALFFGFSEILCLVVTSVLLLRWGVRKWSVTT